MYHIFIADKSLSLLQNRSDKTGNRHLVVYYESDESIKTTIETLEQDSFYNSAEIIYDDVNELYDSFAKQFKIIAAAGGLVINKEGKVLMIYRHYKWDLPKGKIEKDEKKKAAAMRE
ncbi:MAG: NUDIX hydrolase, partial [Bacteroidia bacterium]